MHKHIVVTLLLMSSYSRMISAWFSPSPTGSALGKKSTALEVLQELKRTTGLAPYVAEQRTAVVTGGNAGIGAVTVSTLALTGMNVVLCARDPTSAQAVLDQLPAWCRPNVSVQQLDLADMHSIKKASQELLQKHGSIDVLVNNAGVMAPSKLEKTAQGLELQFGTNHVGHHMWTRLLLPKLTKGGRVVTVASTAHTMAGKTTPKSWANAPYSPWGAYGQSKVSNILFAKGLQDRCSGGISSVSLHPGVIGTNLWKNTPRIVQGLTGLFTDKTVDQGAATNVYCALAAKVQTGGYYDSCQITTPSFLAENEAVRDELWDLTEKIIADQGFKLPAMAAKATTNGEPAVTAGESIFVS
jgi:NAD(P)-dependent dehydrogenase (short-subunit alcohol dehydrogenase family)